ncbi:hypothetical protein SAMN05192533_11744 [Mesobacillus persicus]|uniref:Uncharacterized protein n=1 Tax=Mesobacillus persicus TaxID=930146 RepID=A0A1H8III3_9BACI|nr:hypothetical protein [Mesobacillus persicus]SEN67677.1 hypothetical protein SAMN05192533_11744 [Mesobacillus persicus]
MVEYRKEEIAYWYDEHSKSILSYILLMVKDYQQSEDLDYNPMPQEILRLKEDSYELYNALGELKDTYRKVIILTQLSQTEIGRYALI